MKKLSPTQQNILKKAASRADGNIEPLPSNVNAGVKQRVIQGLLTRSLIAEHRGHYKISALGLTAIGMEPPAKRAATTPRTGTKQSIIISLLERPHGASIPELCNATGWQQHTVRGTFAGTLKKRFNLTITSTKDNGERRYYIEPDKNKVPEENHTDTTTE